MHTHLVFVTKFRHEVFGDRHLSRLEQIMRDVCTDFEAELVEFNGEHNHVHLLVNYPPKVTVTRLVNSLKGFPPAVCGRSSPTSYATTTRPTNSGPAHTSPDPSAGHH